MFRVGTKNVLTLHGSTDAVRKLTASYGLDSGTGRAAVVV